MLRFARNEGVEAYRRTRLSCALRCGTSGLPIVGFDRQAGGEWWGKRRTRVWRLTSEDQVRNARRSFSMMSPARIGGREIDLGLLAIGLPSVISRPDARCSNSHEAELHQTGGEALLSVA